LDKKQAAGKSNGFIESIYVIEKKKKILLILMMQI
jgi:hypothetical protein